MITRLEPWKAHAEVEKIRRVGFKDLIGVNWDIRGYKKAEKENYRVL